VCIAEVKHTAAPLKIRPTRYRDAAGQSLALDADIIVTRERRVAVNEMLVRAGAQNW